MDKELNNDFLFLYKKVINLKNNLTSEEFFLNIESDNDIAVKLILWGGCATATCVGSS